MNQIYAHVNKTLNPKGKFIFVARHPFTDFTEKKDKDYFKQEVVSIPLYDNKVNVTSTTHTLTDYLSKTFLGWFKLDALEEGDDQRLGSSRGMVIPSYIAIAATKR